MAAPLSQDLRKRIIATWKREKLSARALAARFEVGASTVTRLKRQYRETKAVTPKSHGGGRKRLIGKEQEPVVEALVQRHPDWSEDQYAKVLAEKYGIFASAVTVGRAIRRLGYSVKKRPSSPKSETGQLSPNAADATSSKSEPSPLRVWFLWTKRARTSR
jgi:transposase